MRSAVASVVLVGVAVATAPARADQDYFRDQTKTPVTYRVEGARSADNKLLLGAMAGGALVVGGLGLTFHIKSRNASDDVTAFAGDPTNTIYTDTLDQRRIDAEDNKTLATVFYAVGATALAATVVTYIVTSPPDEIREYGRDGGGEVATPYVVPVEGGAMLGTAVRF